MAYTKLKPRFTPGARVEELSRDAAHYRLTIPPGKADGYRLAQLDDYAKFPRGQFPHRFPPSTSVSTRSTQRLRTSLSLSARTSSDSIPGTWGFGLWNDPFGLSLGFGGNPWRLPVLPNAVWFFGASEENYLSFRDPRAERNEVKTKRASTSPPTDGGSAPPAGTSQREAVNGFLAQTFRSPKFHPLLILAGLVLPFSRKTTRQLLSRVIAEDGIQLLRSRHSLTPMNARESASYAERFSVDPTQWHRYRLDWHEKWVSFEVDEVQVFESPVSPNPPLGLVIWIDNQYAAFTPEGKIRFGVLANPEPVSLEIRELEIG